MIPLVSGYTIIKDAVKMDFPLRECILSLLSVCDEVIVLVHPTRDGTAHLVQQMAEQEPRIRPIRKRWWNPARRVHAISDAANACIQECAGVYHLYLQADEVIDDETMIVRQIAQCGYFDLVGFPYIVLWKLPTLVADGFGVSRRRMARRGIYPDVSCQDHELLPARDSKALPLRYHYEDAVRIIHYGFVRRSRVYADKEKAMGPLLGARTPEHLRAYLSRIARAKETVPQNYYDMFAYETKPYTDHHPPLMLPWLRERHPEVKL